VHLEPKRLEHLVLQLEMHLVLLVGLVLQ
jgi:hypothetical protein